MDALKEDLKAVDKKIKELIDNDPQLKEIFDIVDSAKGIGPVIATEVLITTNEFKDVTDPKKYAASGGVLQTKTFSNVRGWNLEVSPPM